MTQPSELARPAATVVVTRQHNDWEILMLKRSDHGPFGNMWVFPGGRVDDDDAGDDDLARARSAAEREAREEVGLVVDPQSMVMLSHWTPPLVFAKRFSTWFFVAEWAGDPVQIDGHEIVDSKWITPQQVLDENLFMAPPTYVTVHTLAKAGSLSKVHAHVEATGVEHFVTRPAQINDQTVMLWSGDAGYDSGDASLEGPRHRMYLTDKVITHFERDV